MLQNINCAFCHSLLVLFNWTNSQLKWLNLVLDVYRSKSSICWSLCCGGTIDTFKMVTDDNNIVQFAVPHHYESNVKAAGDVSNAARARRLAQEAVTLSTSLPLSASSSVFVRCDEERLDVMKVCWCSNNMQLCLSMMCSVAAINQSINQFYWETKTSNN